MYSSAPVYGLIAKALSEKLTGLWLTACFSNTREEITFHFEGSEKIQLTLKFTEGEIFFFTGDIELFPGKNAVKQFRILENHQVNSVVQISQDRCICLDFGNAGRIYIKGYGRFGNLMMYTDQEFPESTFRKELKTDLNKSESTFRKADLPETGHDFSFENYPWITKEHKDWALKNNAESGQETGVKMLFRQMQSGDVFIIPETDPPALSLLQGEYLGNGWEALQAYASKYISRFYFLKKKEQMLHQFRQKEKHIARIYELQKKRLEELTTRRSYKELGDILLTYAHAIKPGVSSAFVTDYFTGNQIRVKLDPELNVAENAKKYYRKAKNEIIETARLKEEIVASQARLQSIRTEIETLVIAQEFRQIKRTEPPANEKKVAAEPYRTEIFMGFEIWIGKHAKANDEMLKRAGKNDLWLHARGYAGSHVIIRKKSADFPEPVIAYAAKLAAENSKAKTQKLVPVYCVERKYVTKPKNAMPGEVVVLKEAVVDAELG